MRTDHKNKNNSSNPAKFPTATVAVLYGLLWTFLVVAVATIPRPSVAATAAVIYNNQSTPLVYTAHGWTQGLTVNVTEAGTPVGVFQGIPYAAPPIHELRFERTKPFATPWEGVLNATSPPPPCIQFPLPMHQKSPDLFRRVVDSRPPSEDCLYLNIFVPGGIALYNGQSGQNLPVMIWFHGGSFAVGSASLDLYNATALAAVGNVIVVTVNYRLGPLGFMYHGQAAATGSAPGAPGTGNQGLWDQDEAIKWVYDNIYYFGGDKERITLFGGSAGSVAVSAHLSAVHNGRQYAKGAILQSGSAIKYSGLQRIFCRERALEMTQQLAQATDCHHGLDPADWISCMKYAPIDLIMAGGGGHVPGDQAMYGPMFGDEFLPETPQAAFLSAGNFKTDIPLLTGVNGDEGAILLINWEPTYFGPFAAATGGLIPISVARRVIRRLAAGDHLVEAIAEDLYLRKESSPAFRRRADMTPDELEAFRDGRNPEALEEEWFVPRRIIHELTADLLQWCPSINFGRAAMIKNVTSHVYSYLLEARPRHSLLPLCDVAPADEAGGGACHGDELVYTFGHPLLASPSDMTTTPTGTTSQDYYTQADRDLSRKMIGIWSTFARTGTVPNEFEWPHYLALAENDRVVTYHKVFTGRGTETIQKDFRRDQCGRVWNRLQPLC